MAKKPSGGAAMDAIAAKLIQVPKRELDRLVKRHKAKKARRKKS